MGEQHSWNSFPEDLNPDMNTLKKKLSNVGNMIIPIIFERDNSYYLVYSSPLSGRA